MGYSNNGDYELLIEQITDAIVARLNGDAGADQGGDVRLHVRMFPSLPNECIASSHAGAARIGLVLGQTGSATEWAGLIDHTLLKPEATDDDIKKLARKPQPIASHVCVNPTWVRAAACNLRGSGVPVCTVIGFPLGATLCRRESLRSARAIFDGAREVDMVINVGALKSGDDCLVEHDIRSVAQVAHEYDAICKVIIETALLTDDEKVRACQAAKKAPISSKPRPVPKGGATVADDVALMRRTVGSELGVKASGGVKGLDDAQDDRSGRDTHRRERRREDRTGSRRARRPRTPVH